MGTVHPIAPARAARMASLLLNRHSQQEIADAVEILVDVLDMLSGDPDLEDDDPSGQSDEDGVNTAQGWPTPDGYGAGCPISDPDVEGQAFDGGGSCDWPNTQTV